MSRWTGGTVVCLAGLTACAIGGCAAQSGRARAEAEGRWRVARAQVKARLAADQFAAGNVAAASGELIEAHRLDPNNPDHIPLRVRIWLAEGRLDAAANLLEDTELAGPRQAEIEYLLGVVREQQQRWADALVAYQRAARLAPDEVAYVVAAAQGFLQIGQPRAALEYLGEHDRQFAWTDAFQAAVAECYEQMENWSAAASAWQRVVDSDGADRDTRERLAVTLFRARRYVEAIPLFEELLDEEPTRQGRWMQLMLAECYLAEGRGAAAREQVQAALRWDAEYVPALRLLARTWATSGDYAAALRCARQGRTLRSDDPLTLELIAALAWRSGQRSFAEATARELEALDPNNQVAQRILRRSEVPIGASVPE